MARASSSDSISKVRVTTTTEVLDTHGNVLTSITQVAEESGGNPAFVTRMAHRRAEENADVTRKALGSIYGEVDEGWKS